MMVTDAQADKEQERVEAMMDKELTWEQERDIADYEAWQAEQAWETKLGRMIIEDERAQEAGQDNPIGEFDDCCDDWSETVDYLMAHAPEPEPTYELPEPPEDYDDEDRPHYDTPGGF